MGVYGKQLQRWQGFVNGDEVRDSSVYLDGHVLYADILGVGDSTAAFVVRGLNASTNAPTELFRVNKDGTTTVSVTTAAVGDLSSSYVAVGSINAYAQILNASLGSPVLTNALFNSGSIAAVMITDGTINSTTIRGALVDQSTITTGDIRSSTLSTADSTIIIDNAGNAPALYDKGSAFFNILAFGASQGPSFNNFSAIAAACSAAYGASGGVVFVPGGEWLTDPFELGNRVTLQGAGMRASTLKMTASQNAIAFITNHQSASSNDPYGRYTVIRDLRLDGNKAAQASLNMGGIYHHCPDPGSYLAGIDDNPDSHQLVQNVIIENVRGIGLAASGAGENRWTNVHVITPDGHGFHNTFDSWITDCTSEKAGMSGFEVRHGSFRMENCKAFYSGTRTYSTNGIGAGFYLTGLGGDGFVRLTNCEAQDNGLHGFALNTVRNVSLINCASDTNGWGNAGSLATPGTFKGIDMFNAMYCTIIGYSSSDRVVNHGSGNVIYQQNALRMKGTAGAAGYNYIQGTHSGFNSTLDASQGPPIASGDIDGNNPHSTVIFNGNTVASALVTSGSAYFFTT